MGSYKRFPSLLFLIIDMLVKKKLKDLVRLIIKGSTQSFLYCLEKDIEISYSKTRSEFYPYHLVERTIDQIILKNIKESKIRLFNKVISNMCIEFKDYRIDLYNVQQVCGTMNFDSTFEVVLVPDCYSIEFFK